MYGSRSILSIALLKFNVELCDAMTLRVVRMAINSTAMRYFNFWVCARVGMRFAKDVESMDYLNCTSMCVHHLTN